jgi:hypothetical protein
MKDTKVYQELLVSFYFAEIQRLVERAKEWNIGDGMRATPVASPSHSCYT